MSSAETVSSKSENEKTEGRNFKLYGSLPVEKGPPPPPARPPEHMIMPRPERHAKSEEDDEEEPTPKLFEDSPEKPKLDTYETEVRKIAEKVEPVSEENAPTYQINKEMEMPVIQPEVVAIVRENIAEREPDPDTDAPAEEFLEGAAEGKDIKSLYENIKAKLGITPEDEAAILNTEEITPLSYEEVEDVPEDGLEHEFRLDGGERTIDFSGEALPETTLETDEDDPLLSGGGHSGGGTGAHGATGSGAGAPPIPPHTGGGGGGGRPPHGPGGTPGAPFGPPGGFGGPGRPARAGGGRHGPAFGPASPVTAPTINRTETVDRRMSPVVAGLFGGVVGYLIGRRRGRIKTEKKLLPVQKKLEKQVTSLQFEIQEKESNIRKLAAEQVRRKGPVVLESFAPVSQAEKPEKIEKPVISPIAAIRLAEVPKSEKRQKAPEARQLHGPAPKAEKHIGHVLMNVEATPVIVRPRKPETGPAKSPKETIKQVSESTPEPMTERKVETLSRAELLSMSEKILVDGSSLRRIYETNLIGEHGLRRLVAEHLRGGDVKRALRQEITEREIDFERDPAVRDMKPDGATPSGGGTVAAKTALDQMVQKASQNLPAGEDPIAYYKARAAYEASQYQQEKRHNQVMDISLVSIIAILLGFVIYLAIR